MRNRRLIRYLIKLAVIVSIATGLLLFVIGIYPVHGNQMFPMLKDGDLIVTQKVGGYIAGDVVTYKIDGIRYYSRIIAVEGDEVNITGAGLLVNGLPPAEEIFYTTLDDTEDEYPVVVGDGEVFVLNDFRSDSNDSRVFGLINIKDLNGKVIYQFRRRSF